MSSKKSPASKSRSPKMVVKVAMFLGLGIGFSGELAGAAWLGWWVGQWWVGRGGPKDAPGLSAAAMVLVSLAHVTWLLYRISIKQENAEYEDAP